MRGLSSIRVGAGPHRPDWFLTTMSPNGLLIMYILVLRASFMFCVYGHDHTPTLEPHCRSSKRLTRNRQHCFVASPSGHVGTMRRSERSRGEASHGLLCLPAIRAALSKTLDRVPLRFYTVQPRQHRQLRWSRWD